MSSELDGYEICSDTRPSTDPTANPARTSDLLPTNK